MRDEAEHLDIPKELLRREDRLKAIAKAKVKIELRAERRYARESAEYDKKMADRKKKAEETHKKPKGRAPKPPEPGVRTKDQINLIDEESRIMPGSGGGFEQAYNAQASVEPG